MPISSQAQEILAAAQTILLVDWPSAEVPANLARSGLHVIVRGGQRPDQYSEHAVIGDEVVVQQLGRAPDHADLVYSYRPIGELPDIVDLTQSLGAKALWMESAPHLTADADQRAREIVEGAGLLYLSGPDIVGEVRRARGRADGLHHPGVPS